MYSIFVKKIVFPVLDLIKGTYLSKGLILIKKLNVSPRTTIDDFQNVMIRRLLKHAYNTTTHYRRVFQELGINDFSRFTVSDLKVIPKTTKKMFRENPADFVSHKLNNIKHKNQSTGGSTGEPLRYLLDYKTWSMTWGQNLNSWESTGYKIGDKVLLLGSSSIFNQSTAQKLIHILLRLFPFSGVNMSDEACQKSIKFIRKHRISFIYGYASAIYVLSKYVIENNIDLKLTAVFPTSEVCPEYYKESYKTAFGCTVMDCYGARDGGLNAFQCSFGNYHLSINSVAIYENPGISNNVLLTDLYNYAMPFINYEVGDAMELSDNECLCGNNSYIATKIYGRKEDVVEFSTGDKITGPGWTILFKGLNIEKYKMIKSEDDTLIIQLVVSSLYNRTKEEKIIHETFRKNLHESIKIKIEYVDDLYIRNNGKASYFIA